MIPEIDLFRRRLPPLSPGDIHHALLRLEEVPTLPHVVERILSLTSDLESNIQSLVAVVSRDQAITARLLKVANSAYYSPRSEVRTVKGAIMTLGFEEVRSLCVAMKMVKAFPKFGEELTISMESFWRHSIACGQIANLIAAQARASRTLNVEDIFCCGLLHDFGKIVIHQCFPKHFLVVTALAIRSTVPGYELENQLIGADHAYCGHIVAQRWKIPRQIVEAIGCHHNVPPTGLLSEGVVEAAAIHLADHLAHRLLEASPPPDLSENVWHYLPETLQAGMGTLWGQADRVRTQIDLFYPKAK